MTVHWDSSQLLYHDNMGFEHRYKFSMEGRQPVLVYVGPF